MPVDVWIPSDSPSTMAAVRELCGKKWPQHSLKLLSPKYYDGPELRLNEGRTKQVQDAEMIVGVVTTTDRVDILQAYAEFDVDGATVEYLDGGYQNAVEAPPEATVSEPNVDAESVALVLDQNADQVCELVPTLTEEPYLRALLEAEQNGKKRKTVIAAIEDQLAGGPPAEDGDDGTAPEGDDGGGSISEAGATSGGAGLGVQ